MSEGVRRVGFIGLGVMGKPMARHILKAGRWELSVFNRTRAKERDLVAEGARSADPAKMASECEAVLLCLPTSVEVSEVTSRLLSAAGSGLIIADHSTIQPRVARRLAARADTAGVRFLDAPVTGGEKGAVEGTLGTMVGGDEAALEAVRPVLETFSSAVTHMGPSGNGQMTKMANQILCGVNLLAAAEVLSFAERNGLDGEKVLRVLSGGAGDSWALRNLGPKMTARDYRPGFSVDLQLKDLVYALEAAEDAGAVLMAAPLARQLCGAIHAQGRGGEGIAALYSIYEMLGGKRGE